MPTVVQPRLTMSVSYASCRPRSGPEVEASFASWPRDEPEALVAVCVIASSVPYSQCLTVDTAGADVPRSPCCKEA